jgi:phenylalanyl-tRNA synthetase beta chain
MRVPVSWLRELVELDVQVPELAHRLTMAGLEVEAIEVVGSGWSDVTIGRVVELERHPRLDNLNVAGVDRGNTVTTVVTAAPNLYVGAIVPYVAPGGRLPYAAVGRREFSGITSEGMVCSGDELDISPDKDGIYIFEESAPVGEPVERFLSETVLDIYVGANRPDCMSVMGLAREVHALFGAPYTAAMLRLQDPLTARVEGSAGAPPVSDVLTIRIEDPVGCPRFTASVVRNIQIGPSPQWLQRRLHFAGVRPISNVVDVTNYVMLEVGQPLHAFDRQRLNSEAIVVRRALEGESLRTLDGEDRQLGSSMMVVADKERARSLAGIMGGEDSEIADTTTDVVLEGASWDRATIRLTSSALGLSTEASRRFGRGVDPDLTALGVARATALTLEFAGGTAAAGVADEYPGRQTPPSIEFRVEQLEALLGTPYTQDQVVETLDALGFEPRGVDESLSVTVPGWRRFDVEGRADVAEEVARIVGFEIVPATMLRGALPSPRPEGDHGFSEEIRARLALAAAGLQEVITYSAVDPDLGAITSADGTEPEPAISIANPMSAEASVLRTSLLGSLLRTLRSNHRQRERVLLFELARTWHGQPDPLPDERRHIGIAMVGLRYPRSWSGAPEALDFFDLKGIVDTLCDALSVEVTYAPSRHPSMHPGRTAEVCAKGRRVGVIGQLHPQVAERFDLEPQLGNVLVGELDFELLLELRTPLLTVSTPSRFPPSDRDIAIIIDEEVRAADVQAAIQEAGGQLAERVELFDVYRGEPIPPGRKSLAFALRYRAADRTLEDEEVSTVHGRIEQALRDKFRGEVRGR